jgi:hypothetical protein
VQLLKGSCSLPPATTRLFATSARRVDPGRSDEASDPIRPRYEGTHGAGFDELVKLVEIFLENSTDR